MPTGLLLRAAIPGAKITGGSWGIMSGCATDFCSVGIDVRGENTVSIAGGTFWNHHQSLIVDGEKARVRISGAELKSNGAPVLDIRRADQVVVSGCSLIRTLEGHTPPAVLLRGGKATLTGCNGHSRPDGIASPAGSHAPLRGVRQFRDHLLAGEDAADVAVVAYLFDTGQAQCRAI